MLTAAAGEASAGFGFVVVVVQPASPTTAAPANVHFVVIRTARPRPLFADSDQQNSSG
jgi:hypothetical protein